MTQRNYPPGFSRVIERAATRVKDHKGVARAVEQASAKASKQHKRLRAVHEELGILFRMLKAWSSGAYRAVPVRSITMALAAVLYFLLPLDFIPDFILGTGFLDDIAVIGFVLQSIGKDIDLFRQWEGVNGDERAAMFAEGIEPPSDKMP